MTSKIEWHYKGVENQWKKLLWDHQKDDVIAKWRYREVFQQSLTLSGRSYFPCFVRVFSQPQITFFSKVNNNKTFSFSSTAVTIYRTSTIQKSKYYDNNHCSTVVNEINRLDQPSPHETVHQNVYQSPSREETVHREWVN